MNIVFILLYSICLTCIPETQHHIPGNEGSKSQDRSNIKKFISINSPYRRLILFFANIGECPKCLNGVTISIDSAINELTKIRIEPVAIVKCKRISELSTFRIKYNWNYNSTIDTGNIRAQLKIPENTRVAILNENDSVLATFSGYDFTPTAYSKMKEYLTNSLK